VKKKLWKKPKQIVMDIGKCKYCQKDMVNTESFVVFATKEKAHYECMKKDDELKEKIKNKIESDINKLF
tara:strand:- start:1027 stop:1233 length:207 start_codon:yes stop_codon:yes gene_type:complete